MLNGYNHFSHPDLSTITIRLCIGRELLHDFNEIKIYRVLVSVLN